MHAGQFFLTLRAKGIRPAMVTQFACADFGKSILWRSFSVLALFYIVEVLGLDARVAGLILLASLAFDAISDPVAGNIIDAWLRRGHSLRPIYLIAPACAAVFLCTLFSLHFLGENSASPMVVLACLLLFRLAYTFVDVPANLASATCSLEGSGQTVLWSVKRGFAQTASLIVAFGAAPIIKDVQATGESEAFLGLMAGLCALAVAAYAISARSLPAAGAIWPAPRNGAITSARRGIGPTLLGTFRSKALVKLVLVVLAVSALCDLLAAGVVFLDWKGVGGEAFASQAIIALAVGATLAVPAGLVLGVALGKPRTLRVAALTIGGGAVAFYFLPDNMAAAHLASLMFYACGLAMAPLTYWSMAKSTIGSSGQGEMPQSGAGLSMALLSAAVKVGGGINAALLGFAIHMTRSSRAIPEQEADTLLLEPFLVTMTLIGACACYGLGKWLDKPQNMPAGLCKEDFSTHGNASRITS